MTYTDSQILDLIDDLHSVGQTEEPKEELKRLLKEWEIEVGVHKIQEKSPKEIADLQRYLGIQADGIFGLKTRIYLAKASTQKFYGWMQDRGKPVQILEVQYLSGTLYLVLYKDYAANFRTRSVLASSEVDLDGSNFSFKIWDHLPEDAMHWKDNSEQVVFRQPNSITLDRILDRQ